MQVISHLSSRQSLRNPLNWGVQCTIDEFYSLTVSLCSLLTAHLCVCRYHPGVIVHRLAGSIWLRLIQTAAGGRPGLWPLWYHSQGSGWPHREGALCWRQLQQLPATRLLPPQNSWTPAKQRPWAPRRASTPQPPPTLSSLLPASAPSQGRVRFLQLPYSPFIVIFILLLLHLLLLSILWFLDGSPLLAQ